MFALPVRAFCILLIDGRNTDYAACIGIACEYCGEDTQQSLGVKTIGLGSSGSASNEDARRLDDMIFDAMCHQESMQPESVAPSFKATHQLSLYAFLNRRKSSLLGNESKQSLGIAGFQVSQSDLLEQGPLQCDEPGRRTEFEGDVDDVTRSRFCGHGMLQL